MYKQRILKSYQKDKDYVFASAGILLETFIPKLVKINAPF